MEIKFQLQNYRCFGDEPAEFSLKSGVTGFIGANNSGKSTILRFFFEFRPLFIGKGVNWVAALRQGSPIPLPATIRDSQQLFHKGNDHDIVIGIHAVDVDQEFYSKQILLTLVRKNGLFKLRLEDLPEDNSIQSGEQHGKQHLVKRKIGDDYDLTPVQNLLSELAKTVYVGPYRSISEVGPTGDYFDMQVGQAFVNRWNAMKTGENSKNTDAAVAVEREIQRVFKFTHFQINAAEDRSSLQIIIDNWSYKIQELGSGLSQFIISLAHAAMSRPRYVLIDEPESNLHASMQLTFVTSLASYAPGGLLFASHNLGLARSVAERIYVVSRKNATVSAIRNLENKGTLSEVAGELNFSAYQELGFSSLLLVEGPTEVKTVQQFLRKLGMEQHVLIIPLGGNSMINGNRGDELRELMRITTNVFALVDSEKSSEDATLPRDREAFGKACKSVGIHCHLTDRRSLENYFPAEAIKAVYGKSSTGLGPFESVKSKRNWMKSENWRIAQEMRKDDLVGTDLEAFFDHLEKSVQPN
jgi:ABC-type cobalamin/Fe3+-siderophores transport system ATPase subunit